MEIVPAGNMYQDNTNITIVDDYISCPGQIVSIVSAFPGLFSIRESGTVSSFRTAYGESKLKSMFSSSMPNALLSDIKSFLPDCDSSVDEIVINRYDPGDFLLRHVDAAGGYWKLKLIFLQSSASHFTYYVGETPFVVEEVPGRMIQFPLSLPHSTSVIEEWEKPKYSMVLIWR
jgi:hypothetical protein